MIAQGAQQSLSVQDARKLAVWAPSIAFARKFTNMYHVQAARSCRHVVGLQYRKAFRLYKARYKSISVNHPRVEVPSLSYSFRAHLSLVERSKYRMHFDCQFARHFNHPHETFSGRGLGGESATVHRQRLAFAASVRSKKKKKRRI